MRCLSLMLAAACLAVPSLAQSGMTNVTASHLESDMSGALLTGKLCLTPVLGTNPNPVGFTANGGAQVAAGQVCYPVTGGALNISVPDTALAAPTGIGYKVALQTTSGYPLYSYTQPIYPNGATWSLDSWTPTQAANVTVPTVSYSAIAPSGNCGTAPAIWYTGPAEYLCVLQAWVLLPTSTATLPTAGAANQPLVSTGPGTTYHAGSALGTAAFTAASAYDAAGAAAAAQAASDPAGTASSAVAALPVAARTGSYTDLTSKPTIPAAVSIDGQAGAITFTGGGVSHAGLAYTFSNTGGMTWPALAGIPNYNGSSAYGTSYSATNPIPANFIAALAYDAAGAAATAQSNAEAALTGDVTKSANAFATTLATVNSNTGACGDATHVCQVTLDGKGRATAASAVAISSAGLPTLPTVGTVPYSLISTPSGGVGGAAAWGLAGIGGRTVTTTTDTVAATDRGASITYNSASAVAVTLTSAATLGNNFDFVVGNLGAGTATFTPGAGTINGASTLTVAQNESCAINSQDNTNYVARCGFSTSSGGSGIANTTFTNATTAIAANSCSASAATVTLTGLATTSVLLITPSTDVSGSTGWGSTGGLAIDAWPSAANTMSYKICNATSASITPAAVTWNAGAR
jgi:hypothetical protein